GVYITAGAVAAGGIAANVGHATGAISANAETALSRSADRPAASRVEAHVADAADCRLSVVSVRAVLAAVPLLAGDVLTGARVASDHITASDGATDRGAARGRSSGRVAALRGATERVATGAVATDIAAAIGYYLGIAAGYRPALNGTARVVVVLEPYRPGAPATTATACRQGRRSDEHTHRRK